MEKVHLLCNAHLDPAWLWPWNEGLAEALSTFRIAADFCEQYDTFVFNHNEAVLYEWVEEHEPKLFERIKALVKKGRWKIMGGWYIQPDCVMPSGESFLSQIALGREYFKEKFGIEPTTAINFDPFGHTRGLVQILSKTGFDSYIAMRPEAFKGNFIWKGADGSEILVCRCFKGYNSLKGQALEKIKNMMKENPNEDVLLCPWGIGNHGGGPSKIDLEQINEFIKESGIPVIHSSAEEYMADLDRSKMPVVEEDLVPFAVGCYTSMVRIKQANRRLENKIALTEKAMCYAEMTSDFKVDREELKKAKKALAFSQFHDILPGSGIKKVEEDGLKCMDYGEEIVDRLYMKAFLKLTAGQKKAKEGEIPVLVFNPHPFEVEEDFEVEFLLQNQNWAEEDWTFATVYDEQGNKVASQHEQTASSLNLDWVKKVCFRAKVAPSSVSRFNCKLQVLNKNKLPHNEYENGSITIKNDHMTAAISRKTGLIEKYIVDGKERLVNAGKIEVYRDNEDPWGMTVNSFTDYIGEFTLMSDEDANAFAGYPNEEYKNVRIIEDGEVRTTVQAIFKYKRSVAVVEYILPKNSTHIDVNITLFSNEVNRMIKYNLSTALGGQPIGETAFAVSNYQTNEDEVVFQKWCGFKNEDGGVYVINRGTYGGSFNEKDIKISLLRTPIYSAHPIADRDIAPHNSYCNHIDMGERHFSFRIVAEGNLQSQAQIFNEQPQVISFFPSGEGEKTGSIVTVNNPEIIMSSFKKNAEGYGLVLHNFADHQNKTELYIKPLDKKLKVDFGKYELKILKL
ncbi:MAG: alpha-mannosidase [Ruminococcaceae bacterium]|nr:alpha-mannosidase [Oscillospiraceae bacterium]